MASVVTVKLIYQDKSKSLVLSYPCADSDPSAEIVKSCEDQALSKWEAMGGTWRTLEVHTVVKRS